jgi:hypothetical protein
MYCLYLPFLSPSFIVFHGFYTGEQVMTQISIIFDILDVVLGIL